MLDTPSQALIAQSKWVVVNTQPHREIFASDNLTRQGFHVYCPMIMKRIKHARRVQDALRPLFPGYIFTQLRAETQQWRPILGTYGVKSLVRNGDELGFIGGDFIDGLRARELDGVIRKPSVAFEVGQKVAVQGGPFDGLVGEIIQLREKDRVLVLLNLLCQPAKTQLSTDMLNPL
jgi:transcriptional antiterminator RfaH